MEEPNTVFVKGLCAVHRGGAVEDILFIDDSKLVFNYDIQDCAACRPKLVTSDLARQRRSEQAPRGWSIRCHSSDFDTISKPVEPIHNEKPEPVELIGNVKSALPPTRFWWGDNPREYVTCKHCLKGRWYSDTCKMCSYYMSLHENDIAHPQFQGCCIVCSPKVRVSASMDIECEKVEIDLTTLPTQTASNESDVGVPGVPEVPGVPGVPEVISAKGRSRWWFF